MYRTFAYGVPQNLKATWREGAVCHFSLLLQGRSLGVWGAARRELTGEQKLKKLEHFAQKILKINIQNIGLVEK